MTLTAFRRVGLPRALAAELNQHSAAVDTRRQQATQAGADYATKHKKVLLQAGAKYAETQQGCTTIPVGQGELFPQWPDHSLEFFSGFAYACQHIFGSCTVYFYYGENSDQAKAPPFLCIKGLSFPLKAA